MLRGKITFGAPSTRVFMLILAPLDQVNVNANAAHLASKYTSGHLRPLCSKAEEAPGSIAVFIAQLPKGEITP
jgi:hypothetical protein